MPRQYSMRKRARSAASTRDRLVRATFELHGEQGVAATTMKQIAARADVSVGTAYHHFPTYEDAIRACGAFTDAHHRPPGPEAFKGERLPRRRLVALAQAYFAYYAELPAIDHLRRDQAHFPMLRQFVDEEERHRQEMTAAALSPLTSDRRLTDVVAALIDVGMFRALQRLGHDKASAAALTAELAMSWLSSPAAGTPGRPRRPTREVYDEPEDR